MGQQASIQCLFYVQHCAKWIGYNPCSRQAKLFLTTEFHIPCRPRISSKPFQIGVFCVNASAVENLICPKTTHPNIGNSNCWEVHSVRETPSVSGYFQKRLTSGTWKNQKRPCEVAETWRGVRMEPSLLDSILLSPQNSFLPRTSGCGLCKKMALCRYNQDPMTSLQRRREGETDTEKKATGRWRQILE